MKKVEKAPADVGVIVGRFQVNELHSAHVDLIQSVCDVHSKVIIFLGLSPLMVTQNNPLDFESRKQMILEIFPSVIVLYIKDTPDDKLWSADLDEKISDVVSPNQTVVLYGSRDCFIKSYFGKYDTQELIPESYISGSEVRKSISKRVKNTPEFRAGVIWAAYNKYSTCYTTVDIAIFNDDYTKLLLARKAKETLYRFVGGFADPSSVSFEADARREVHEETSLDISDPEYVSSGLIDDWRYRGENDKIKTILFKCKVVSGRPIAQDDICELRWFDLSTLTEDSLVSEHRTLIKKLQS